MIARGAMLVVVVSVMACSGGAGGGDDDDDGGAVDAADVDVADFDAPSIDAPIDAPSIDAPAIDAAEVTINCDLTAGGGSHIVYLSFDGETLLDGTDDAVTNHFMALQQASSTIPGWRVGWTDREAQKKSVACDVRAALQPYDVSIVLQRPASGDYQMVVLGGDPSSIQAPFGIKWFTASDCAGSGTRNIGYVEERDSPSSPSLTLVATRNLILGEIGRWSRLDNVGVDGDCMCLFINGSCPQTTACTYGANTPLTTMVCQSGSTENEPAALLARYGARP